MRDCPATWSASIHSIGLGSQVYDVFLEEFPEGDGNAVDDEHRFSSTNRWSVSEDHTGFRGHATSMSPGS